MCHRCRSSSCRWHRGRRELEWFADALHGDLVIEVARLHHSLVIARDTAATYKGKAVDPRQVAREMGVRHVVSGSLRQEGRRILLNLALIDGETGVQRWAETFSIDRARLQQTVGDFAVAIERTLAGELFRSTAERRSALSPTEVSADDLAMQGYALWYRGVTRENVLEALALLSARSRWTRTRRAPGPASTSPPSTCCSTAGPPTAPPRSAASRRPRRSWNGSTATVTTHSSAIALQYFLKRDFPATAAPHHRLGSSATGCPSPSAPTAWR